jgi:hypothetical protein
MKHIMSVPYYTILLLCLGALSAQAATFYVGSQGNDATPCAQARDAQTPRKSINGGIACLSSGDTLIIGAGTYDEVVGTSGAPAVVPGGLSAAQPTTIKAAPGETVLLQPITSSNRGSGAVMTMDGINYVVVDGINIDGWPTRANYGLSVSGQHNRFQNMDIKLTQQGAFVAGSAHEFRNLHVHHIGMDPSGNLAPCYGASSNPPTDDPGYCHGYYFTGNNSLIDGGSISTINGHGVQFYSGGVHSNTMRNVLVSNTRVGIGIYGPQHQIYNNVLADNQIGLLAKNSQNMLVHNTVYGGDEAISDQGSQTRIQNNLILRTALEAQGTVVSPASHDFHLVAGSRAIAAGVPVTDVAVDKDGCLRPSTGAVDVGAYQYAAQGPVVPAPQHLRAVVQ